MAADIHEIVKRRRHLQDRIARQRIELGVYWLTLRPTLRRADQLGQRSRYVRARPLLTGALLLALSALWNGSMARSWRRRGAWRAVQGLSAKLRAKIR